MTWRLSGKPFEVQSKARELGRGASGFAYFMEMGLGKTAVTLDEFLELVAGDKVDHLVVMCPNSLKNNWRDEIANWGIEGFDVVVWPAKPRYIYDGKKNTYKLKNPTVFLINYESSLFSGGEELSLILENNRCMWALDESSRIKNFNAKSTKALIAMSPKAPVRRVLTGTPMSQSVLDLWAQLRFIGELMGVNPYVFRNRYAVEGGFMGKQIVGVKNEEQLQEILRKCSFQAKKVDWTDLPKKSYQTRHVEMTKIQQDAYNDMKRDFLLMMNDATVITAPMVITQLTKLQQISRGFIYDEDGGTQELVLPGRNPCIDVIHEIMDEIEGKLIIMVAYKYSASALFNALYKYHPARLIGGLTADEVTAEKAKFNNDTACRITINQIGVGGIGHTLLGQKGKDRCATMLFYENTFSLEKRAQAEDRNHRHGQDTDCVYIDLSTSPIDKRITQALQRKEDIVRTVMDGARDKKL